MPVPSAKVGAMKADLAQGRDLEKVALKVSEAETKQEQTVFFT